MEKTYKYVCKNQNCEMQGIELLSNHKYPVCAWCWTKPMLKAKPSVKNDSVNHPAHYTFGKFEVTDVLEDWFGSEPLLWFAVRYIARSSRKGAQLEDLKKAKWYLERRISRLEGK